MNQVPRLATVSYGGIEVVRKVNERDGKTIDGLFWLKNLDTTKLWGTLTVSPTKDMTLKTFGSLLDTDDEKVETIIGQVEGGDEFVTLLNCFVKNTKGKPVALAQHKRPGEIDWSMQTWRVNTAVEGLGFEKEEEVEFSQITATLSTLARWVMPDTLDIDWTRESPERFQMTAKGSYREPESATAVFGETPFRIALNYVNPGMIWQSRTKRIEMEDSCNIRVAREDGGRMKLGEGLAIVAELQNLLTICYHAPAIVNTISVRHEDEEIQAEVTIKFRGDDLDNPERGIKRDPILEFDEIGRMEGVARWIEIAGELSASIDTLMANWYNSHSYVEDQYAHVFVGLEGMLAKLNGMPRAQVTERNLIDAASALGPVFLQTFGTNAEDWARAAKEIRDTRVSHIDPNRGAFLDPRKTTRIRESLYVLGIATVLKEMGVGKCETDEFIRGAESRRSI